MKVAKPIDPPKQTLWGMIKKVIKYPFFISGKFSSYNKGISDLIAVKNEPRDFGHGDSYYRNIQKRYLKSIWAFIYAPILIGALVSGFFIYKNIDKYAYYKRILSYPVKEERFVKKLSVYSDKILFAVKGQPVSAEDVLPFVIGYMVALLGANICSRNPVFAIQDNIQLAFIAMGCVDIDGKPWKIIWTPEAVLITSFGRDPIQLAQDAKFWATINFPPSSPKQSTKDLRKFVVQRRNELMSNMEIKVED